MHTALWAQLSRHLPECRFAYTSHVCVDHVRNTAEAQKKSLQKLMTQKSHSFTVGDSPMAGQCAAPRFDHVATDSPLVGYSTARRFDEVLVDSQTAKGLSQKLTQQSTEFLSLAKTGGMPISPSISSSFVNAKLQEQPEEQLVQKVVTRTEYAEAQQLSMQGLKPRTFIRSGSLESDSSVTQNFADVHTKAESHDHQSQLRVEDMQAVMAQETTVYSQQSSRGLQKDPETGVALHEPEQQAMAGSTNEGASAGTHVLHRSMYDYDHLLATLNTQQDEWQHLAL